MSETEPERTRRLLRRGPDPLKIIGVITVVLIVAQIVASNCWPTMAGFLKLASILALVAGMILSVMRRSGRI